MDQNSRQYSIEIVSISSETLSLQKKIIEMSYQVPIAALRAGKIMVRKKPKLVVGFGGLSTFPILLISVLLKIPLFIQEQNAVLGRVNRLFQVQQDNLLPFLKYFVFGPQKGLEYW